MVIQCGMSKKYITTLLVFVTASASAEKSTQHRSQEDPTRSLNDNHDTETSLPSTDPNMDGKSPIISHFQSSNAWKGTSEPDF